MVSKVNTKTFEEALYMTGLRETFIKDYSEGPLGQEVRCPADQSRRYTVLLDGLLAFLFLLYRVFPLVCFITFGFGKFNFLMMMIITSLIMAMAFEIVSVAYLVPVSACELNTTNFEQGLMAGVPLMGIIATSHFWGYLADTRGRRKILVLSLLLGFIAGSSSSLSPNWIVFSLLKFLSSCAVAGTYALSLTLLSECTPYHRRSIMVALTSTIYFFTTGIMAVLTIPVLNLNFKYPIPYLNINFTPWRLLTLVYAIPSAFGSCAVYWSFESPRFLLRVGEEEKALNVLKKIFSINTGKSGDDFDVDSLSLGEDTGKAVKGMWASLAAQTMPLLKPPLLKNTLLLAFLFTIVYFTSNSLLVWLPFIADAVMKSIENGDGNATICDMIRSTQNATTDGVSECGLNELGMISVFAVSVMIAALNAGLSSLINIVGKKRLVISIQLVAGVAGLCINSSSSLAYSGVIFIVFLSGILNFGYLSSFSVDSFPTYVKAMAVCLTLMVGRGSSVFGISILKSMFVIDCELAFYTYGGLTILGAIVSVLLPGDGKSKKNDRDQTESSSIK